jgi:hypothetical protein
LLGLADVAESNQTLSAKVETMTQENKVLTAKVDSLNTEVQSLKAYQMTADAKILELNVRLEDYMNVGTDLQHQLIGANQRSGSTIHSLQQDNLTYRASINTFQTTNNRLLAGQLAYTFEKTVIQQFKFPIEFQESEMPTTFSALEKLLKEDWRPWTETPERQVTIVAEKALVENAFLQYKSNKLRQGHYAALKHLKGLRSQPAHPSINITTQEEYDKLMVAIEETVSSDQRIKVRDLADMLCELQREQTNKAN